MFHKLGGSHLVTCQYWRMFHKLFPLKLRKLLSNYCIWKKMLPKLFVFQGLILFFRMLVFEPILTSAWFHHSFSISLKWKFENHIFSWWKGVPFEFSLECQCKIIGQWSDQIGRIVGSYSILSDKRYFERIKWSNFSATCFSMLVPSKNFIARGICIHEICRKEGASSSWTKLEVLIEQHTHLN